MKLTYRGVAYEYNPPVVEMAESRLTGKYRGLDWRFRNLKKSPVIVPPADLMYRGVRYQRGEAPVSQQPTVSTQEKARELMMAQHKADRDRALAMFTRVAAEVGLQ